MPKQILSIVILLAFALSACAATVTPSSEEAMSDVYTAVALTFDAGLNAVAAQATFTPAPTSTFFSSPTSITTATMYPTATTLSSVPVDGCYRSAYVSDVTIEDGTEIAPGESFVKTWKLQNTGRCAWDNDYLLTFYGGDEMDGEDTTIDEYVASGNTAEVSVALTAPETDGTYTGYWILADSSGTAFGTVFYVQIVVSSDLVTPTSTSTDTPTSTSTSTTIPTGTSTSVPTETPTQIPTGTSTPVPTDTSTAQTSEVTLSAP